MNAADMAWSLAGGVVIGLAAALLLVAHGKIAGISGILGGLLERPGPGDAAWRAAFLVGLVAAGGLLGRLSPESFSVGIQRSSATLLAAGLLVGLGARYGSGCTSGHGVCGISRLSPRSISATVVFMLTGALSVWITRQVLEGAS